MAVERTLSIVKPDAVGKNVIGKIYSRFETNGLQIVAARMMHLSAEQAGGFYAEHRERPFFPALIEFMTSGPIMVQVLEGENAVAVNRDLMGATNPEEAAEGTIRADFASTIDEDGDRAAVLPAAHAKKFATEMAEPAIAACVQAMGANGLHEEHLLGRWMTFVGRFA